MNLRRIGAIVLRQYYLMRTSPTRLVPLFAWAAIDIVLWGFIARCSSDRTSARRSMKVGPTSCRSFSEPSCFGISSRA